MRNRRGEKLQERDYKVLILLWEKEKTVCAWISFSKTPDIELKKRWLALNPNVKPETLMWNMGVVKRDVAAYALQKWQADFVELGFQIAGQSEDTVTRKSKPNLKSAERARLAEISVDALLRNREYWRVTCKNGKVKEKSCVEKFAVNTARESLCIRVTEEVANAFRQCCRGNSFTQSQAMAYLLDQANEGGDDNLLVDDLTDRLDKADKEIKKAHQKLALLQKALGKERQGKEYPKKYQAARLQNELLKTFFNRLSAPESPGMIKLKKCSARISAQVFPERREYTYPDRDGVILLYLEHIAYGKPDHTPLFIYGKDVNGNKKKVRWYYQRSEQFGVSMWDSPYLLEGAPWLLAVQKTGDVADMVGSLPVIDVNWSNTKTMEDVFELQEVIEKLELYIDDLEQELDLVERENTGDVDSEKVHMPLEEVIRKAKREGVQGK